MKKPFSARSYMRRSLAIVLCLTLLITAALAATYAYVDDSEQHRTDYIETSNETYAVFLQKNERDGAGNAVPARVGNAAFVLYQMNEDGSRTQIGDSAYQTDADGQIFLEHLERGEYVFVETDPSYGYTYDSTSGGIVREYPFAIDETNADQDAIFVQAFNRRLHADLTITKTVINADGAALSGEQAAEVFDFTVTFGDSGTYTYQIDGGAPHSITSGGVISLAHGQAAVISSLPVGVWYAVTELPHQGYAISSTGSHGTLPAEGATAAFTNTALQDTGQLIISKQVTGDAADAEKPFTFLVTFADGETGKPYTYTIDGGEPQPFVNGDTITLKHGQTAVFSGLPVGLQYIVEEQLDDAAYAAAVSKYEGVVLLNADVALPFVNHHESGDERGSVQFQKTVTGDAADLDKLFRFVVSFADGYTEESGEPPPVYTYRVNGGEPQSFSNNGDIYLKHGDVVVFENLPAQLPYQITEDDYTADGYLSAVTSAVGTVVGGQSAAVAFTNAYTATKLVIKKEVAGAVPETDVDKAFQFTLWLDGAESETFALKDGEEKTVFLPYGAAYTVVEQDYFAEGYVQSIVNGSGTAAGQAVIEILQTNRYTTVTPVVLDAPVVSKIIAGDRPLADTVFAFTMMGQSGAPMPAGTVNGVKTVTIAGNGQTDFGEMTYTKAGTYEYRIAEVQGNAVGYTYDAAAYRLVVVVEETDTGLHIESAIYAADGETVESAAFTNVYNASVQGEIVVSGQKTWQHGNNPESNRPESIVVYVKNGTETVAQKTVTAADHWQWSFALPKYDAAGAEIAYTIDEGPVAGYTKSISGYSITNTYQASGGKDTAHTDDTGGLWIWIATLPVGGAAVIGAYKRKRKTTLSEQQ